MMKKAFLLFFILPYSFLHLLAQGPITVELTRKMYPEMRGMRKKFLYDTIRFRSSNGRDSSFRPIDSYNIIGGNVVDGKVKFTIAVNLKYLSGWTHNLMLAPYNVDTIRINDNIGSGEDNDNDEHNMIMIKAFGKEYEATLNQDGSAITLQPLEGHYTHPDLELYDSLLPDATFKLLQGGTSSFKDYKNHDKYIYVVFWNTWEAGNQRTMQQIDELKNLYALYNNALTVIGFHYDTIMTDELDKEKNIDWIEAHDSFAGEYFPAMGRRPSGILFNPQGKAVAIDIDPMELKREIERLLHVSN